MKRPARRATAVDPEVEREAAALEARGGRAHPCHACPERAKHERWAERASKLEQQMAGVERRIRSRTETLARQFDRVLAVLEELGLRRGLDDHGEGPDARADLRRGRHPGGRGARRRGCSTG